MSQDETEQETAEPNATGFQTYAANADAGPGTTGRHRKLAANVTDLRAIESRSNQTPDDSERAELEDVLLEAGCTPTEAMLERLDTLINRIAFVRCAEALRHIVRSLGDTPAGRALERVLLGNDGQSLETDAKQVGCSRQNIHHHEKTARARLSHLTTGTSVNRNSQN